MASIGPIGNLVANIAPRRKRTPRKLNYLKCTFCRNAKVKCEPLSPAKGEGKCQRCRDKNLTCSSVKRKSSSQQAPNESESSFSRKIVPIVDCSLEEHDMLAILSLHHIFDLGLSELVDIGLKILEPLKGDRSWTCHREKLDRVVADYDSSLEVLRGKLKNASNAVAQVVLTATIDISYPNRQMNDSDVLEELDRKIHEYESNSHCGIAYILHMQRLRQKIDPTNEDVDHLIHTRNSFIDSIDHILKRQHVEAEELQDITETQLFVPRDLFLIPAVAKAVEKNGRMDCLWRPIGHILHDNEVEVDFRLNSHEDGRDIMGRSRPHIAAGISADDQYLPDLAAASSWGRWLYDKTLGLNALHIAAIHGNTHVFHARVGTGAVSMLLAIRYPSSSSGRTCMHWAACCGHLELVGYLIKLYQDYTIEITSILDVGDEWDDTPLHLAARNGHTEVVKAMVPHIDWTEMNWDLHHTPFWAATAGRHLDIMKLLIHFCDVNDEGTDDDHDGWLTPLAEAARQGFIEGVRYLLSLNRVRANSINDFRGVLKTPLDHAIEGKHSECVELLKKHGALTRLDLGLIG